VNGMHLETLKKLVVTRGTGKRVIGQGSAGQVRADQERGGLIGGGGGVASC